MKYAGLYRNGQSSRTYPATMVFEEGMLWIEYRNEEDDLCRVIWSPDEVTLAEASAPEEVTLFYHEGLQGSFVCRASQADISFITRKLRARTRLRRILFITAGVLFLAFWIWGLPFVIDWSVDHLLAHRLSPSSPTATPHLPYPAIPDASQRIQRFATEFLGENFPSIRVIEAPFSNAAATVWGEILVSDKILTSLRTPDELAALLYHEYGHLVMHHPMKLLIRHNLTRVFFSLLGGNLDLMRIFVQGGGELVVLHYSRHFEELADDYAITRLARYGFDPAAMERLLATFDPSHEVGFSLFSTHPSLKERIARLRTKRANLTVSSPSFSRQKLEKDFWRLLRDLHIHQEREE